MADNDKNALLSQETKDYMAFMHTVYPEKCAPFASHWATDVLRQSCVTLCNFQDRHNRYRRFR